MKLHFRQVIATVVAGLVVSPALSEEPVRTASGQMPELTACLAKVEKDDTAGVDACVNAHLDEIRAVLEAHPDTASPAGDADVHAEDEDE